MSKHTAHKHGLARSMDVGTRRFAAMLGALTLTLTLVFAGLLYRVGSLPGPVRSGSSLTAVSPQDGTTAQDDAELLAGQQEDGVEVISDEANPLAAAPSTPDASAQSGHGFPVHLVLGFSLGFVVVFFISHIMRVDASISDMNRKTR